MNRIVTLLPGATEFVAALGLLDRLVGRSHECDLPAGVGTLPALTEPRFALPVPSEEVHRAVVAAIREGQGFFRVDDAQLRALAPDLVITQDQCEVCAVSRREVESALGSLASSGAIQLVALNPHRLEDVIEDAVRIASAAGVPERGRDLSRRMHDELEHVRQRVRALPRRRAVVLEWLDPPMASGSWIPELVEVAGGYDVLGRPGLESRSVTIAEVAAADAEAVIVAPCGYSLERTLAEWPKVRESWTRAWPDLGERRLFAIDGNRHLNRPGPRIAESAQLLARAFHPEVNGGRTNDLRSLS